MVAIVPKPSLDRSKIKTTDTIKKLDMANVVPNVTPSFLKTARCNPFIKHIIEKNFRGKKLNIKVNNPNGNESGCKKLTVNGTAMEGSYIPASILKAENEVVLEM